jgi:hypothetical protein
MGKRTDAIVIDDRPYVVEETLPDGRLVLRPDTGIEAIRERVGSEAMSPEHFKQTFGDLPNDSEG